MNSKKNNTGPDANVSSVQIPDEIIFFLKKFFLIEQEDPGIEILARAEILSKVLIKFMLQLYRMGIEEDYQPVFLAANYAKPHSGGVSEFKRTYEIISGEPHKKFNLTFLAQAYEKAYQEWIKETFGVELDEQAAKILQQWGGVES